MFMRTPFSKVPELPEVHLAHHFEDVVEAAAAPQASTGLWQKIVAAFSGPHMQPEILSGAAAFAAAAQNAPVSEAREAAPVPSEGGKLDRALRGLSGIDPVVMREIEASCADGADVEGGDDRCPPHHLTAGFDGPVY